MENSMVPDETMNNPNLGFAETAQTQAAMLPQLALMPLGEDYSQDCGRQDEDLPSDVLSILLFDDEDNEDEDMDDGGFDDMDDDFDDDFDDEDEDYEDEDEDYDYEDVEYDDDFDE